MGYALTLSVLTPVILLVYEHRQYDNHHHEDIYRVVAQPEGKPYTFATTPVPLADVLRQGIVGIRSTHVVIPSQIKLADRYGTQLSIYAAFVDDDFFNVFNVDGRGAAALGLHQPQSVVITESTALRLFGTTGDEVIGQVLSTDGYGEIVVSSVLTPQDEKTHLDFDAYMLSSRFRSAVTNEDRNNWKKRGAYAYVVPEGGNTTEDLSARINSAVGATTPEFDAATSFSLQSVKRIARDALLDDTRAVGRVQHPALFLVFGGILFLLATLNYFNLFIARSATRLRETGIRRVFGVSRYSILLQYFVESLLILLISTVAGLLIMYALPIDQVQNVVHEVPLAPPVIAMYGVFLIFLALLTGVVPYLIVSRGKPAQTLKDSSGLRLSGFNLQRVLLSVQLTTSLVAGIVLLVMLAQSRFSANADYGFDAENLWVVDLQGRDGLLLKNAASQIAGVERTGLVSNLFGYMGNQAQVTTAKDTTTRYWSVFRAGDGFVKMFGLEMIAGSDLQPGGVLINEQGARALGFDDAASAVGSSVFINDSISVVVAGVLRDFHFDNFKRPIRPLIVEHNSAGAGWLVLELNTLSGAVKDQLTSAWNRLYPGSSLSVAHYDSLFRSQRAYVDDVIFLSTVTVYIIVISLLSLLGMIMHDMHRRAKAITIRKALGARTVDIVRTLSREFWIVFITTLFVAIPVAWYISAQLLNQFVVRITLNAGLFVLPSLFVIGFATLIVLAHAVHHARKNPAKWLRYE